LPLVAALLVGVPADAERVDSKIAAKPADQLATISAYFEALQRADFKEALALSAKLNPGDSKEARGQALAFRATALLGLKDKEEATRLYVEADQLAPRNPGISKLQFLASMATNDLDLARIALDRMIARFPDVVRELDLDVMRWIVNEDHQAETKEAEDRLIALARLGYGAGTAQGDFLAYLGIKALVKRRDVRGAEDLLAFVNDPDVLQGLLIERKFSALWPKVEATVGPHFEKVRNASVDRARKRFEQKPNDPETLSQLAFSLSAAGRYDEVIALQANLPATSDAISKIDEHTGWVFDTVAGALFETGRTDEADKLYASLNENTSLPDSWLVNMKINRLYYLVSEGKFDRALALLESTEKVPGSAYAKQLVRRMRYCILRNVDRSDEAAKFLPQVLEHAKDSYDSTIEALICAGDLDQAEKIVLTALVDEDFQSSFVSEMQPVPLEPERSSIWSKGWEELRKRPALVKEFERLGRPMPSGLRYDKAQAS
jgi:tetratricopeptide (TPR) repeat protein